MSITSKFKFFTYDGIAAGCQSWSNSHTTGSGGSVSTDSDGKVHGSPVSISTSISEHSSCFVKAASGKEVFVKLRGRGMVRDGHAIRLVCINSKQAERVPVYFFNLTTDQQREIDEGLSSLFDDEMALRRSVLANDDLAGSLLMLAMGIFGWIWFWSDANSALDVIKNRAYLEEHWIQSLIVVGILCYLVFLFVRAVSISVKCKQISKDRDDVVAYAETLARD